MHERDGTVMRAFRASYVALPPRYGHWPLSEHCLPFYVARVWDELSGKDPVIWTP